MKEHLTVPNIHRLKALNSYSMKVIERLVLTYPGELSVRPHSEIYQPHMNMDVSVIYVLQRPTFLRIDFAGHSRLCSSALQCYPASHMVSWIEDYLTDRRQFVRLQYYSSWSYAPGNCALSYLSLWVLSYSSNHPWMIFCSVAGCVILLKDTAAIREYLHEEMFSICSSV